MFESASLLQVALQGLLQTANYCILLPTRRLTQQHNRMGQQQIKQQLRSM